MPKYLESFGESLYPSSVDEDEQAQNQPQSDPPQQAQPQPEPNPHPTHPLSQALFQAIYNKGHHDGSSSTLLHRISNYITAHPIPSTTMVLLVTSGGYALSASTRTPNATKRFLVDSASNKSPSMRMLSTTPSSMARRPPYSSSPSGPSGTEPSAQEYKEAFAKLREDLHAAQELLTTEDNIGTQLDGKVDVKDGINRSGGTKPVMLSDALLELLGRQGLQPGEKVVFDMNTKGEWSEPEIVDATEESAEGEDSSIPSTYLSNAGKTDSSEGLTQDEVDEINAQTPSSPMADPAVWSKVRFSIVEWGEASHWDDGHYTGPGTLTIKMWNDEGTISNRMTVLTSFEEGIPVSIYRNGLMFEIDETPEDLPSGEPIWKFERLLKDVKKDIEMKGLDEGELYSPTSSSREDLDEPTFFDNIILSNREANSHIFKDPVPPTKPEDLIRAIENDQRVEFWLDEKMGYARAVGESGKVEMWKVRVGVYELYDTPTWSELHGVVYFNGPPLSITIDRESEYSVDLFPGNEGQWVVKGQEEE
ncbi:hypothetical protein I302_104631 [Kwoniella bestiolae CBS 10118]|uniref:Uncharacterized protein n=1 Tax=Kwoniella bestiolae CBS 10118 TaxID=1296100 RepID=A0A1B9GBT2_9TREE|nr:hypothetical protein I302_03339 [Kwoniella bestiolae CBS 10118]OCF28480.1 hypothetical protein I302_03339 [Kwoniella bestiolae CBS 10118]